MLFGGGSLDIWDVVWWIRWMRDWDLGVMFTGIHGVEQEIIWDVGMDHERRFRVFRILC